MKKINSLLFICIGALFFCLLSFTFFRYTYPVGGDFSPYLRYAEMISNHNSLNFEDSFYQFGLNTTMQPLAPTILVLLKQTTGLNLIQLTYFLLLFGILMIFGVYSLINHLTRDKKIAMLSTLIFCLLPLNTEILSWGNFANVITLFLIPVLLVGVIQKKLLFSSIILVSISLSHPLSLLFIVGILGILFVYSLFFKREDSQFYIFLFLISFILIFPFINIFIPKITYNASRFYSESISIPHVLLDTWTSYFTSLAVVLSVLGLLFFIRNRNNLSRRGRNIIFSLLTGSLILIYAHLFGISIYYSRFLWFISIPLICLIGLFILDIKFLDKKYSRIFLLTLILIILIIQITPKTVYTVDYYHSLSSLSPQLKEGFDWINQNTSEKSIIIGDPNMRWMSYLVARKNFVVFPESLIGPADQLFITQELWNVLNLNENYKEILSKFGVDYIILSKNRKRSLENLDSFDTSPNFKKVYENEEVVIFKVNIPSFNSSSPTSNSTITATN